MGRYKHDMLLCIRLGGQSWSVFTDINVSKVGRQYLRDSFSGLRYNCFYKLDVVCRTLGPTDFS